MSTYKPERPDRRLAAILAADVAGYSRMIGADEDGTLDRLRSIRADMTDPKIAEHCGRIGSNQRDLVLLAATRLTLDDATNAALNAATSTTGNHRNRVRPQTRGGSPLREHTDPDVGRYRQGARRSSLKRPAQTAK
jgi:class 3 adenylate cyclase